MPSTRHKIIDIRATTVTVPLTSVLRHANGCHWGRFVRTIVEVETNQGLVGYGELGGGGDSAETAVKALLPLLKGHNPFEIEALKWKIANPTASLYNNRTQILAALEFACLDIVGKELNVPVHILLGGKLREEIEFASYMFFTYPAEGRDPVDIRDPDQLVDAVGALKNAYGFNTHKLKGGVFPPGYELQCYQALAAKFPDDRLRYDPNAALSLAEAIDFGLAIEGLNNDYYEDPVWGLNGLRQLRERVNIPLATNTVVVNFEQLATNLRDPAADVILLDTTFWGGIRPCIKAAGVCETFQVETAVHSSGELGIQLATMLHFASVLPSQPYAADAHYHHLTDDIIVGGLMPYENGRIKVPDGPGLGIEIDSEKVAQYNELFKRLGGYDYDRDYCRPGWHSMTPNKLWADPTLLQTHSLSTLSSSY